MAPNTQKLSAERLDSRRARAVQLRIDGEKLVAITQATGLSRPTIVSAYKAYQAGGWHAVTSAPRGRPTAASQVLTTPVLSRMREALTTRRPSNEGLHYPLWCLSVANQWLVQHQKIVAPQRTIRRLLSQWGLSARSGFDEARASPSVGIRQWAEHGMRAIVAEARSASSSLFWLGERELARVPGDVRQKRYLLYAHTPRGQLFWQPTSGWPTEADWLDFLKGLMAHAGKPVVVIARNRQLGKLELIQNWLIGTVPAIEIVHPPVPESVTPATELSTCDSKRHVKTNHSRHPMTLTHLQRLEAESIHIMREVVAESDNPVMLYSVGKDSAVMLRLAMKAFHPAKPPFPLLHVDTRWKFKDMYALRDRMATDLGLKLLVHINPEGVEKGINPFTHGSAIHTDIMKTEGLKQALDQHGFDAAFGGARRDEEKSRAKERIFSFRTSQHRWDPKNQRPELWNLYNTRKHKGESLRVFPLSNWTELDIWQYIYLEQIPIVPLYFAAKRPVVERDGALIMVDDDRMPLKPGEVPMMRSVRFRTLGCYPLTGAVESEADTLPAIIQEMLLATTSERQGRVIDHDSAASMEKKKQEGYF